MEPTELCWKTGNYTPECDCYTCDHKYECSGADLTCDKDDDDEDEE